MPYAPRLCTCEYCGTEFMSKNQRKAQRFCSTQCSGHGRHKPKQVPKRRRGEYRTCPVCNKEFWAKRAFIKKGYAIYCSQKCKGIASRLSPRPCEVCGKEFQPAYNTSKRFCSAECRHQSRLNGQTVNCTWCNTPFYLSKIRLESSKYYFCCVEHFNKWQARNKVTFTCKMCGIEFQRSLSHTLANNTQYCSLACRDADPEHQQMLMKQNQKQQIMKGPTSIEKIGYALLDSLNIEYIPQHIIGNKFCVDAFIPALGIVIQFDGDYWHGHPDKFPNPDKRQQKRMRLDISQDAYMRACGYQVLRFWGTQLRKEIEHVTKQLQDVLTHS